MRIYVCLKQVPDTETRIKIAGSGDQIEETGVKWIINPYDEFAIEEAIQFKGKFPDARITAVTVGPKARVTNALLTAMAMGADDALIVDTPAQLDALTTAKALAAAIKKEGDTHLIFSGKQAIDGSASAVSQMLAELLEMPCCSVVGQCEYEADSVTATREVEGGKLETYKLQTPALIAANKGLNKPRFASLPGIMKAKKKPVQTYTAEELGIDTSALKVRYSDFKLPEDRPACEMIAGEAAAQAKELARKLREEAKVL